MIDTMVDNSSSGAPNLTISFMVYPPSLYAIRELGEESGVLKEARQELSIAQMTGSALTLFCMHAMMQIGVRILIRDVLSMN